LNKDLVLVGSIVGVVIAGFLIFFSQSKSPPETAYQIPESDFPTAELNVPIEANAAVVHDEGEQDMEMVLGLSVRRDRNCMLHRELITGPDGDSSIAYRCDPNEPKTDHPYAVYSMEYLRELAYRDADASEVLGVKLIKTGEEDEGLQFIYRSVALNAGNSMSPLKRTADTLYSSILSSKAPNYKPEPAFSSMERAYVFDRIRDKLTGNNQHSSFLRNELESYGYTDFEKLEKAARDAITLMVEVEQEVVGSNSIKEKIDA